MADYKKGDIAVRIASKNVIGVIIEPSGENFPNRWVLRVPNHPPDHYDACHEDYLRLATPMEIRKFNENYPGFVNTIKQIINMCDVKIKLF